MRKFIGFKPTPEKDKILENCGWANPQTRFCEHQRMRVRGPYQCFYCSGFVKRAILQMGNGGERPSAPQGEQG